MIHDYCVSTLADGVRDLLTSIGEDPTRDGLLDTPKRFVKAFVEMTDGYFHDPEEILSRQFEQDGFTQYDGTVVLRDISFHSLCEHHLLPFYGTASIAYIPNSQTNRIVGISKLARLVECYARRLQVQERLNAQIADSIAGHLQAEGVMVIIKARHMCMIARGIRRPDSEMVTSKSTGLFQKSESARAECMKLLGM